MALTAQLDIDTKSGDGDTSCAIDPAFWAANQSTIQGYASAAGVTLYYQDTTQPGAVSANINTLGDAQYQINRAANLTAGATGPIATSDGGVSTGMIVAGVAVGLGAAGLILWLIFD